VLRSTEISRQKNRIAPTPCPTVRCLENEFYPNAVTSFAPSSRNSASTLSTCRKRTSTVANGGLRGRSNACAALDDSGHFGGDFVCNLTVTLEDVADSFGTTVEDIPEECRVLFAETDFRYNILEGEERDRVILDVLKKTDLDRQRIGAAERKDAWQQGWEENLRDFVEHGYDLNSLTPKFIRPNRPIRFKGNYILPANPMFELAYLRLFRLWLFKEYFADADFVYEFGCGTGFNLVELARLYPEKKLYGLDFVPASVELVNKIGQVYRWNLTGHLFDMTTPDDTFHIDKRGVVLTFGALEQLAGKFEAFLQFLFERPPALCVNIEPTVELYDRDKLFDYLAIKFHEQRGYSENYLPRLIELENQGKVDLLKAKRLFFGSLYMEGYTCIIWRPRERVDNGTGN